MTLTGDRKNALRASHFGIRRAPRRPFAPVVRATSGLLVALLCCAPAHAADDDTERLAKETQNPAGPRTTSTAACGTQPFYSGSDVSCETVANPNA